MNTEVHMNPVIVILYPELAGYFISCVSELQRQTNGEIHIFKTQVNKEAPFKFDELSEQIKFYNESDYSAAELKIKVKTLKPNLLYCAGWSNKKYLEIVRSEKSNCTTLLGFDNKWDNSLKQKLQTIAGRIIFQNLFDFAFVPGKHQRKFAQKLGFKDSQIIRNAYSADYDLFHKIASETLPTKLENLPKKFLFVGRYIKIKGIFDMWQAFEELQEEFPNDWELWCLGTGAEYENRSIHPKIKHFGFIQPKDFKKYLAETRVYILPSHFEPWGVSVHEMAICGFPMILSDKIGAGEVFLRSSVNGLEFQHNNIKQLKEAMRFFVLQDEKDALEMIQESKRLASNITPTIWAKSLLTALS